MRLNLGRKNIPFLCAREMQAILVLRETQENQSAETNLILLGHLYLCEHGVVCLCWSQAIFGRN